MKEIIKAKQKITNIVNNYILGKDAKRFIEHNKKVWRPYKQPNRNDPEVLFEFNGMHSSIIAYSYLANILAEKFHARIIAYSEIKESVLRRIIKRVFKINFEKIYESFNVSKFIQITLSHKQKREAYNLFKKLYPTLKTKSDVEQLTIDGALIGDLIYDTFLRREMVPTIDLKNKKFIDSIKSSIEVYIFWRNYFACHNVKAINISHCVYNLAIPLRIAVSKKIPVYQINATHAYLLNENNLFAYNDFKYFPDSFRLLSKSCQDSGMREAKLRLDRRFAGEVGVDMKYSKKSAYSEAKEVPVLKKSNRIKILIATHCFFDSPHPYGQNLFPDFYEWLTFLGNISEITDYDWYIKTHPDFLPGNKEIIEHFLNKYPRFTLMPADTSHRQIIHEGINFALTVYGTIGFEYAALGVPVINASRCNPHIAYNFNSHPSSVEEYKTILLNLENYKPSIDVNEVYEYYYMKFIYNTHDWLFNSYSNMISKFGGHRGQFESRVYGYFLDELTEEKHNNIVKTLNNFIKSGDFRLNYSHTH